MSYDVECPYCGAEQEINHDDGYGYDEGEIYNQQCGQCDKYFAFTTGIIITHDAHKADCLNDGDHEWEPVNAYPKYWPDWVRCKNCGEENKGEIDQKEVERLSR